MEIFQWKSFLDLLNTMRLFLEKNLVVVHLVMFTKEVTIAIMKLNSEEWRNAVVAIKRIKQGHVNKERLEDFKKEVEVVQRYIKSHPNVIFVMKVLILVGD